MALVIIMWVAAPEEPTAPWPRVHGVQAVGEQAVQVARQVGGGAVVQQQPPQRTVPAQLRRDCAPAPARAGCAGCAGFAAPCLAEQSPEQDWAAPSKDRVLAFLS